VKRETLTAIIQFIVDHLTHTEFVGTDKIPHGVGIIITTNHNSRADAGLLLLTPGRPDIFALAATKYQHYPLFKFILDTCGVVWIDRERADFSAMKGVIDHVHNGGAIGIAPEGTRSRVGKMLEGKPGTVLMADKARVPLVPVGITGTEDIIKKILHFQKPHVVIHYGDPFTLPPMDRKDPKAWLKNCTEEIMCRIAVLVPPAYRGFYADHPRLKELMDKGQN
jgi:1-acyl-sn-glycerol-3-phosphate acyltransferase